MVINENAIIRFILPQVCTVLSLILTDGLLAAMPSPLKRPTHPKQSSEVKMRNQKILRGLWRQWCDNNQIGIRLLFINSRHIQIQVISLHPIPPGILG